MSSSRNYDSPSTYREDHDSWENNDTIRISKRRTDVVSYSKLIRAPYHGKSDDATFSSGFSDDDTWVSKRSSMSGKRRGSTFTNITNSTSYTSDMSSSAGKSFNFLSEQKRVPDESYDEDVRHSHTSFDSGYAKSTSQSSGSKIRIERRKICDYNAINNTKVTSPYRDHRRMVRDHRSQREPRSRVDRQTYHPPDEKDLVEQVRYKLIECSERAKFESPSRRRYRGRRSTKCDELDNHKSRGRKYLSRSPEDLRSPYKSPARSSFRSPFQTPKNAHSVKKRSESRSLSPSRNSSSRSSSPEARRGRRRISRTSKSKYSSRENIPYRRHEASSSESDLETEQQRRRKSRSNELMDSTSPNHSRRRPERDEKHRRSKATRSKRGSRDDENSLSRHRCEDSYLGQNDQSTCSSRCRSRRKKKCHSPHRRDSSEDFYTMEKRSRGRSNSDDHRRGQSPSYRRRLVPRDSPVKFSDWRPECRLQNIEARGGKRDFRKWFKVLPPNVKVDKDVRTDRGVFKKDNFPSAHALDKYLGIKNSRSPVERRKQNSRSPGWRE